MVALVLGEEYEKIEDYSKAEFYFNKAFILLPLANYKAGAKAALERVRRALEGATKKTASGDEPTGSEADTIPGIDLSKFNPENTLLIVPCTKQKIWDILPDAPEYVPARFAYVGRGFRAFLKWAEESRLEKRGFTWFILSGKYGFIEPWHPISNYDIAIDDEGAFPITEDTLFHQTRQKRHRNTMEGDAEYTLADFRRILCVGCSEAYIDRIKKAFAGAEIID
jgi:hypothetical protein